MIESLSSLTNVEENAARKCGALDSQPLNDHTDHKLSLSCPGLLLLYIGEEFCGHMVKGWIFFPPLRDYNKEIIW